MYPGRRHYLAHIPTIALLLIFALAPWAGIALFILRSIDRDSEKKEQRAFLNNTASAPGSSGRTPYEYHFSPDAPTEEQRKARKRQKNFITLCGILGAFLLLAGLSNLGDVFGTIGLTASFLGLNWGGLFSSLGQVLGGGGALALSVRMNETRKLEQRLDKIVGDQDHLFLPDLFAAAGLSYKDGRRILESAIEHGCFGAAAYIDNRTDYLIVRGAAPEPAPASSAEPDISEEGSQQNLLYQLHEANKAISNPVMTQKIDRLEQIGARIFALAEQDPDKKAQLQKFMDYYLPTSLKLLNTYVQMDRQGVQGQNIQETKQNIERSMDLLIRAFENQLDKLFQADALDVSADIAALQGMMNLDGLTGSSDFGPVNPD